MLQWLLEEGSKRNDVTVEMPATRLQLQNFAALHTSSSVSDIKCVPIHSLTDGITESRPCAVPCPRRS